MLDWQDETRATAHRAPFRIARALPRRAPPALAAALIGLALQWPSPASAQAPAQTSAQRLHARAVESYRMGRVSEAYGRFIQLANAGHPPAARIALWMCEQGPDLFGKDWDCTPEEVEDWASLAQVPLPSIGARTYPAKAEPGPGLRRAASAAPR